MDDEKEHRLAGFSGRVREQRDAQQRPALQVERAPRLLGNARLQPLLAPVCGIHTRELKARRSDNLGNLLARLAAHGRKRRSQRGMAVDQRLEGPLQRAGIDLGEHAARGRDVVAPPTGARWCRNQSER